ncbi:hypothetical protein G3576_20225 [Roseomonas stagni]|uniref:Uncharacterized protein n=1 Tax=Falsiroseomonas algicola TaxID=2716930 RepID=A0A6M1LPQ2_9PROT|nr:hypothetical protein [Falsiroseomonas algicola]NGM22356.1 hypothetical protein [Falsiroseomonas algicola]
MKALDDLLLLPNVLRVFRRHPADPAWYLFKEGWPWSGVWAIHCRTDMQGTDLFFSMGWRDWTTFAGPPFAVPSFWLWMTVARRRWLKAHAHRMPRAIWRDGLRLDDEARSTND